MLHYCQRWTTGAAKVRHVIFEICEQTDRDRHACWSQLYVATIPEMKQTFIIHAKASARDYVIIGVGLSVCLSIRLSVCLSVTTITKENVDGSGRNFLGRFLGGKASLSSFAVTIASQVWVGMASLQFVTFLSYLLAWYNPSMIAD